MTILSPQEANARSTFDYDVVVIGAGIAGTIMACELAARRCRVALLESGGLVQEQDVHPLNRVLHVGDHYQGAAHGRFRCLGGTSTRWGGAMLPFRHDNLTAITAADGGPWPVRMSDLEPYLSRTEELFRLPPGPYDLDLAAHLSPFPIRPSSDFVLRSAKWPAFADRNVAYLFDAALRDAAGPDVYLETTVIGLELDESGFARCANTRIRDGGTRRFNATTFVIAAGAIETTRLALLVDAAHGGRLFACNPFVGRYFQDHLSAPAAILAVRNRAGLDRLAGFRFAGRGLRNFRFEPNRETLSADAIGGFLHIAFRTQEEDGFAALRDIYRAIQRRQIPSQKSLGLLARNSGWFVRAARARFIENRVLAPDNATFELHAVTEQQVSAANRIELSMTERDELGAPLAVLHWRVDDRDVACCLRLLRRFEHFWKASGLNALAELTTNSDKLLADGLKAGGGIYHPAGTLRMAASKSAGVVDANLRFFAMPNVLAASTAAFPTGGSANPTMTLILLCLRAVEHLCIAKSSARLVA